MTPEGRVKEAVKQWLIGQHVFPAGTKMWHLKETTPLGWYYMPVQNGMGVTGIADFLGHIQGLFFAIETKAQGKKLNNNQKMRRDEIIASGGVFAQVDRVELVDSVLTSKLLQR